MTYSKFMKISGIILLAVFSASCANKSNMESKQTAVEKELYLPAEIYFVPDSNDFSCDTSKYCYKRMVQSANIALFWDKEFGDNPMTNADETKRFNANEALKECERFYNYYVNDLKIVQKGKSLSDKYKLLMFVFGGKEGTAFGGGEEDKVGVLWTPATRINRAPYGALAHEMGHSFQYISSADSGTGPTGPIIEMSAQYMLWQVYPEWMTFENYHLVDFMKGTHYAFLHPANMYHSPYVLEYWSDKHGKEFFGNLCRATKNGEDPVATYQRMNSLTQDQFNDEMFDASRKFITWDLKRIEKVAKQYTNQHYTVLNDIGNGWYQIAASNCPQNYGYNGIKLNVPKMGTKVVLNFKGIAGAKGYNKVKIDKAGWRYGFLASLKDGSRVYGDVFKSAADTVSFTVPENTEYLWLVVSGAPTEHWPVVFKWGASDDDSKEEQWPYQIKLSGAEIDSSQIK
ncbi:DUF6055 domain-containing protein [Labilibaculum sp. K2S]|uniref:DUF6055 domain-containing protein n=1 Tax=Labilibaculum sp. K2S TaxID=3056386 RepID=UPI0025A41710|nr:DUF6055 domain-containing protein [Labilibaculum sp. K2S]MDM8158587.1 DUF6055 domain-containing protein [Labilibaculum sp. K2S]